MSQICIKQKRVLSVKLPTGYDEEKIQIGIPVTGDEANKIHLRNVGDSVLPSAEYGSNCKRNAYGYSYSDKTQPKQDRYVATIWAQPYGNENASSVAIDISRPCFPRIEVPPTEIELSLFEGDSGTRYVIANLTSIIRRNNLKEVINIFLEIYGFCYIFNDEIKIDETVQHRRCNWEILPPGEKPSTHLIRMLINQCRKTNTFDVARLELLDTYKAEQRVEGINGFHGYYAYVFENYCVLESAIYGNATYIIPKENWELLSQKTKQELIDAKVVVEKIVHRENWDYTINNTFNRLHIFKE